MNKFIGIGRLTKYPELKTTQSNIPLVNFTIAINRQYFDESGEKQADFISCVAFRKLAENLNKYCDKGSLIAVDGRLTTRSYESDSGTKYVSEIICDNIQFLDSKKEEKDEYNEEHAKQVERLFNGNKRLDDLVEVSKKLVVEEDLPF